MKKVLGIVLVLGLFAAIAYFAIKKLGVPEIPKLGDLTNLVPALEKSKKEVPGSKKDAPEQTSWVDEPWQHSVVLNRKVRVESPFPLYPGDQLTFDKSNPYVKAIDSTTGSKEGVHIEASLIVVREDAIFDTRRGMKGVSDSLKAKGMTEVKEKLVDGTIMGRKSCEFTIQGKLKGQSVQSRGVIFGSGRNGVLICVNGEGTDERIPAVWKQLKSGIRDASAAPPTAKASNGGDVPGLESGSPQLPPGFTPRNLGTKEKSK